MNLTASSPSAALDLARRLTGLDNLQQQNTGCGDWVSGWRFSWRGSIVLYIKQDDGYTVADSEREKLEARGISYDGHDGSLRREKWDDTGMPFDPYTDVRGGL
jgi:hypothetical protein